MLLAVVGGSVVVLTVQIVIIIALCRCIRAKTSSQVAFRAASTHSGAHTSGTHAHHGQRGTHASTLFPAQSHAPTSSLAETSLSAANAPHTSLALGASVLDHSREQQRLLLQQQTQQAPPRQPATPSSALPSDILPAPAGFGGASDDDDQESFDEITLAGPQLVSAHRKQIAWD
jgi:hypothetical protein